MRKTIAPPVTSLEGAKVISLAGTSNEATLGLSVSENQTEPGKLSDLRPTESTKMSVSEIKNLQNPAVRTLETHSHILLLLLYHMII